MKRSVNARHFLVIQNTMLKIDILFVALAEIILAYLLKKRRRVHCLIMPLHCRTTRPFRLSRTCRRHIREFEKKLTIFKKSKTHSICLRPCRTRHRLCRQVQHVRLIWPIFAYRWRPSYSALPAVSKLQTEIRREAAGAHPTNFVGQASNFYPPPVTTGSQVLFLGASRVGLSVGLGGSIRWSVRSTKRSDLL